MYSPWTRDGRIRVHVVRIASDVAGLVAEVPVHDNQFVHKGDVLFVIDQYRFKYAVEQARANLAAAEAAARAAGANINAALATAAQRKAQYDMYAVQADRRQRIRDVISVEDRTNATSTAASAQASWQEAQANGRQASATREQSVAAMQQAAVELDRAKLDLARTKVIAPVDGFVTNLEVRVGDYSNTGNPQLALIDSHSYYIYGYFEETKLPYLRIGDAVDIRLMSGGSHFAGTITGVARGITDSDNPTGSDLLSDVNPVFNWVRLAQRVPVRVDIDFEHLPKDIMLSAGMTATLVARPHNAPNATGRWLGGFTD